MGRVVLNVSERNESGKKTRRMGDIPGVFYGSNIEKSTSVKLDRHELRKLLGSPKNSIFSLKLDGKSHTCFVKELQRSIYGKISHIDFQGVSIHEKVKMNIPVVFKNDGFLEGNGLLLEVLMPEVELYGESSKLPEDIEVEAGEFKYGDKVLVKDLSVPEGIKIDLPEDTLIATVKGLEMNKEIETTEEVKEPSLVGEERI